MLALEYATAVRRHSRTRISFLWETPGNRARLLVTCRENRERWYNWPNDEWRRLRFERQGECLWGFDSADAALEDMQGSIQADCWGLEILRPCAELHWANFRNYNQLCESLKEEAIQTRELVTEAFEQKRTFNISEETRDKLAIKLDRAVARGSLSTTDCNHAVEALQSGVIDCTLFLECGAELSLMTCGINSAIAGTQYKYNRAGDDVEYKYECTEYEAIRLSGPAIHKLCSTATHECRIEHPYTPTSDLGQSLQHVDENVYSLLNEMYWLSSVPANFVCGMEGQSGAHHQFYKNCSKWLGFPFAAEINC